EPNPRRSGVFDFEEHVTRFGHVLIAKADDSLNVGQIDAVQRSASHSFASLSVNDDSNPCRIRVFLSKSDVVSPGCASYQTSVASSCRRMKYLNFCSSFAPPRTSQLLLG